MNTYIQILPKDIGKEIRTFARHRVIKEGLEGGIAPLIPNVGIERGKWSTSRPGRFPPPQEKSPLLRMECVGFRTCIEVSENGTVFLPLLVTE